MVIISSDLKKPCPFIGLQTTKVWLWNSPSCFPLAVDCGNKSVFAPFGYTTIFWIKGSTFTYLIQELKFNTWGWKIRVHSDERTIGWDILSEASEGDCITERLLWWCYRRQLHGAEPRVEAPKEPRGSQLPADPPCKENHLLRMSMLPLKPLKGIPQVHSCVRWPCAFDVVIPCVFTALKSLSLRSCRVMLLIQMLSLKLYVEPLMPLSDARRRIRKGTMGDAVRSCRGLHTVTPMSCPIDCHFSQFMCYFCTLCVKRLWHCGLAVAGVACRPGATNLIKSPWKSICSA